MPYFQKIVLKRTFILSLLAGVLAFFASKPPGRLYDLLVAKGFANNHLDAFTVLLCAAVPVLFLAVFLHARLSGDYTGHPGYLAEEAGRGRSGSDDSGFGGPGTGGPAVNTNGLPMIEGTNIDVGGNPYGS